MDRLRGPLGRAPAGLLQRAHRAQPEDPVDASRSSGRRAGATGSYAVPTGGVSGRRQPTSSAAPSPTARKASSGLLRHAARRSRARRAAAARVVRGSRARRGVPPLRCGSGGGAAWGRSWPPRRACTPTAAAFLGIGVLFIPISLLVIALLQALVLRGVGSSASTRGRAAGCWLLVVAVGTALTLLGLALVQAATGARARRDRRGPAGRRPSAPTGSR